MSHPINEELRESIYDNFEDTHPELWNEFKAGRATRGDLDDAIEELFEFVRASRYNEFKQSGLEFQHRSS